jgi:hypothetical protein
LVEASEIAWDLAQQRNTHEPGIQQTIQSRKVWQCTQNGGSNEGSKIVEMFVVFVFGSLWLYVVREDIVFELINISIKQGFPDVLDALFVGNDLVLTQTAPVWPLDGAGGMGGRLERVGPWPLLQFIVPRFDVLARLGYPDSKSSF